LQLSTKDFLFSQLVGLKSVPFEPGPNGTDLSRGKDKSASYRRGDKQSLDWKRHFPHCFPASARFGTVFRSLRRIATVCFYDACGLSQCHSGQAQYDP
jgi:hypothetical protein